MGRPAKPRTYAGRIRQHRRHRVLVPELRERNICGFRNDFRSPPSPGLVLRDSFGSKNLYRIDPKSKQSVRPAKEGVLRCILKTMQSRPVSPEMNGRKRNESKPTRALSWNQFRLNQAELLQQFNTYRLNSYSYDRSNGID